MLYVHVRTYSVRMHYAKVLVLYKKTIFFTTVFKKQFQTKKIQKIEKLLFENVRDNEEFLHSQTIQQRWQHTSYLFVAYAVRFQTFTSVNQTVITVK